jgi:hypothetical protein
VICFLSFHLGHDSLTGNTVILKKKKRSFVRSAVSDPTSFGTERLRSVKQNRRRKERIEFRGEVKRHLPKTYLFIELQEELHDMSKLSLPTKLTN